MASPALLFEKKRRNGGGPPTAVISQTPGFQGGMGGASAWWRRSGDPDGAVLEASVFVGPDCVVGKDTVVERFAVFSTGCAPGTLSHPQ